MSSGGVPLWVPLVVALVGLLVILTAQALATYGDKRRWIRERDELRRREFSSAVAAFAASASEQIQAEFDRSLERLRHVPEVERQLGKQKTIDLRTKMQTQKYLVMLLATPQDYHGLEQRLDHVIEKCHQITKLSGNDKAELRDYEQAAKDALETLIKDAGRRGWSG